MVSKNHILNNYVIKEKVEENFLDKSYAYRHACTVKRSLCFRGVSLKTFLSINKSVIY